jgi:ketosteroid isomerase-like protein
LGQGLDVDQLEMIDFIVQGEKVVVLGHISGKTKAVHKSFSTYFAHVFKIDLKKERIVEFRVFNDSASLAESIR